MIVMLLLAALALAGVAATARAVLTDGYGPRPDRNDRFVDPRRCF